MEQDGPKTYKAPSDNTDFVNELSDLDGVQSAVLVSYNGDYMG